jgi:hypothetical protein
MSVYDPARNPHRCGVAWSWALWPRSWAIRGTRAGRCGTASARTRSCDAKLRQHRAVLEAGADPKIITGWMAETQARRNAVESRMRPGSQRVRISREEITRYLAAMGDVTSALSTASPAEKATMYGQLGLSLTYHLGAMRVDVAARSLSDKYVKMCPRRTPRPRLEVMRGPI